MIFLTVVLGIVITILTGVVVSLAFKVDTLNIFYKSIDKMQRDCANRVADLEDRSIKTEDSLNKVWYILKSQPRRQNKKPKQNTGNKK